MESISPYRDIVAIWIWTGDIDISFYNRWIFVSLSRCIVRVKPQIIALKIRYEALLNASACANARISVRLRMRSIYMKRIYKISVYVYDLLHYPVYCITQQRLACSCFGSAEYNWWFHYALSVSFLLSRYSFGTRSYNNTNATIYLLTICWLFHTIESWQNGGQFWGRVHAAKTC